ncbi:MULTISPECIES: lactaldehyde reductase [unclassified Jeotgalibaca]|uniref:lactaldehyde reductase n=1 Tax=unclassified Jeotgalibaca TaxID=2621505 RepID=UPI003FD23C48
MVNKLVLNEAAYFGSNARNEIPRIIKEHKFKNVLVVTQKELIDLGVATKVTELLSQQGINYSIFDEVQENPTVSNVKAGIIKAKEILADVIVAVGGGSAIDTAKAIGVVLTNPEFEDITSLEGAVTNNRCIPIIAVSTTSGTAAEVTINYVITDEEKQRKFVVVDPNDLPIVAIIDTDLVTSMPKSLAAFTGMDALTHAVEGYITRGAWEITDALHLHAIKLIGENLRDSALKGSKEAREKMAIAQYVAGMGFSNAGLGIVHSMAHPLGAVYGIAHGAANAVLLPYVLEFNADATGTRFKDIAEALGVKNTEAMSQSEYRRAAIDAVKELSTDLGIPEKISELGVKEDDLELLADYALNDACTPGNPKEVTKEDLFELYKKAF